jgi:hypothetical protein
MIAIGIIYLALGLIIKLFLAARKELFSLTASRIGLHFIMIGAFNTCVYFCGKLGLWQDHISVLLGAASVLVFAVLMILECSREFRLFRETVEKYDKE